jgi:hypothetical protein
LRDLITLSVVEFWPSQIVLSYVPRLVLRTNPVR